MTSPSADSLNPAYAHAALSILVSSCLCQTLAALGADAFPAYLPLGAYVLIAPPLSAALAALASFAIERERARPGAMVRVLIFFTIAAYALQSLLLPRYGAPRFMPDARGVFLTALCAASFLSCAKLRGFFRAREFFSDSARGLDGAALRGEVRENGYLLQSVKEEMESASNFSFAFAVLASLALLALYLIKGSLSLFLTLSFIASVAALAFLRAAIADFSLMQTLAGVGIAQGAEEKAARMRLALAAIACAAVASLLLTGDDALLPFRLITDSLSWLMSLLPRGRRAPEDAALDDVSMMENPEFRMPDLPQDRPWIDLSLLFAILKRALIVAAAFAFLWFLFKPFFTLRFKTYLKTRRPGRTLRAAIGFLKSLWSLLFRKQARRAALSPAERGRLGRSFQRLSKNRRNPEKERETGRMAKAFIGLIERGAGMGHPYAQASVPLEWARGLAADWPEGLAPGPDDLIRAAMIFEEALYSDRLVGKEKTELYFDIVKRALACA